MKTITKYDPDCAEAAAELWSRLANHEGEDADAQLIIAAALKEYACEADKRLTESDWAQQYKEACIKLAVLHEALDELVKACLPQGSQLALLGTKPPTRDALMRAKRALA